MVLVGLEPSSSTAPMRASSQCTHCPSVPILAGVRVGAYAGDADIVHYLQEVRKHMGMMVPGPAQAAGVVALGDDGHVDRQREIYHRRLRADG
jgi:DNA-binding transcriptional MocR family regulator